MISPISPSGEGAEDHDGCHQSAHPELDPFVGVGDPQIDRAVLQAASAILDSPVAVGIRLHHLEDPDAQPGPGENDLLPVPGKWSRSTSTQLRYCCTS